MLAISFGIVVALATIFTCHWIKKWRNPKCPNNGTLPPGSMGFPIIGETLNLLVPSHSIDVHSFVKKRINKYGSIFKTNLANRPIVVSSDPEVNQFILQQEGGSVELYYMDNFSKLFGQSDDPRARINPVGSIHRYVRSLNLSNFGIEVLKNGLVPQLHRNIHRRLRDWTLSPSLEIKKSISSMIFDIVANHMFGYDYDNSSNDISDKLTCIIKAIASFPLNFPGTTLYKSLKAKNNLKDMIKDEINRRCRNQTSPRGDLLDQAIKDSKEKNDLMFLTDDFISHTVFGSLFASFESISTLLTLCFKILSDYPLVYDQLAIEHEEIVERREEGHKEDPLSWDEYKSLTYTIWVINETLRLSSVSPGLLRRTTKDIQVKGYTIPANWIVVIAVASQHLNPDTFDDPLAFNPYRWKNIDGNVVSKNFMPFGRGIRQCAGAEFSKAFMATFLHVLVTNFKWTKTKGGENVKRTPLLNFGDGIHIKISEKNI
ncbi:cucurbitadienol 11-hydroxylase-like [Impatiens glandulifera]|uniref:cucurbitadienol 11-hydroxylase-like n=1 Tax=Impatiens glandulifera TaxID=253017 RepID=UPI001FB13294|nr:cucurbitadienol 11-hydroxylase-like [Impatiens glandulifera]